MCRFDKYKRIWAGPEDSNCYSSGLTLLETTYPAYPSGLAWDLSTLTGYNYAVNVENDGSTLLDLTSAPDPNSCSAPNVGLFPFPCQQSSTCQESSGPGSKWQPICVGCGPQCCDHMDNDCNPVNADTTANMIVTFSGSSTSSQQKDAGTEVYLTSDAYAAVEEESVEVTVSADFEASPECVDEAYPLSVFLTASDQHKVSAHSQETITVTRDPNTGMHFGIQGNDFYWRTNANQYSGQWADNVGAEVISQTHLLVIFN